MILSEYEEGLERQIHAILAELDRPEVELQLIANVLREREGDRHAACDPHTRAIFAEAADAVEGTTVLRR